MGGLRRGIGETVGKLQLQERGITNSNDEKYNEIDFKKVKIEIMYVRLSKVYGKYKRHYNLYKKANYGAM